MLISFIITISIAVFTAAERQFGPFYTENEFVTHPFIENDAVNYHFELSRINRYEKLISADVEVLRKVGPIGATVDVLKYSETSGYVSDYPKSVQPSLCDQNGGFWCIFLQHFNATFNPQDCSLNPGLYHLSNYSVGDDLRNSVGNQTFYGKFLLKFTWFEKNPENTIMAYDVAHVVKDAEMREHIRKFRKRKKSYIRHGKMPFSVTVK